MRVRYKHGERNRLCWPRRTTNAIGTVLYDIMFVFEMPKVVHIRNPRLGLLFRSVQISILTYFVTFVIWWNKGYQSFDRSISGVAAKVNGIAIMKELLMYDNGAYNFQTLQNSGLYLVTRVNSWKSQRLGYCPELHNLEDARCLSDEHCPTGKVAGQLAVKLTGEPIEAEEIDLDEYGNGLFTGRCIKEVGTCEIYGWCSNVTSVLATPYGSMTDENLQLVTPPNVFLEPYSYFTNLAFIEERKTRQYVNLDIRDAFYDVMNFTIFIKNAVEFPYFDVKRRNILPWMTETYLKQCTYDPTHAQNKFCPVFRVGDMIRLAGVSAERLLYFGGVMAITIDWQCKVAGQLAVKLTGEPIEAEEIDLDEYGNGLFTGRCIKEVGTCEIYGWCSNVTSVLATPYGSMTDENLQLVTPPNVFLEPYSYFTNLAFIEERKTRQYVNLDIRDAFYDVMNFTIFIKNAVEFPYFDVKRRNILPWMTETYLKQCTYDPTHAQNKFCPVFRVGDMIRLAGVSAERLLYFGGVMAITIDWQCDLDWSHDYCLPSYEFRQLDYAGDQMQTVDWNKPALGEGSVQKVTVHKQQVLDVDSSQSRVVLHTTGIVFLIRATGVAGKFNLLQFTMRFGSGLALLGGATIVCDLIAFHFLHDRDRYRKVTCDDRTLRRLISLAAAAHLPESRRMQMLKQRARITAPSVNKRAGGLKTNQAELSREISDMDRTEFTELPEITLNEPDHVKVRKEENRMKLLQQRNEDPERDSYQFDHQSTNMITTVFENQTSASSSQDPSTASSKSHIPPILSIDVESPMCNSVSSN
ncbi:hypothetical protein AHF37_09084 [Paragonimus kellicotti]|nr:hypothetical protein AHF37_09084 [Paragonimus kellicotti]